MACLEEKATSGSFPDLQTVSTAPLMEWCGLGSGTSASTWWIRVLVWLGGIALPGSTMEGGLSVSRIEDVALRLAAIQEELLGLPDGPSERRYELLVERDALREQADRVRG